MKIDKKTNSEIRANKEKLIMDNFTSIMKKLDATFLIESDETNVNSKRNGNSDSKDK